MTVGTQHTHDRAAEYCEHLLTARAPHEPALVEFFALVVHGAPPSIASSAPLHDPRGHARIAPATMPRCAPP
jgi:hypothetical protein